MRSERYVYDWPLTTPRWKSGDAPSACGPPPPSSGVIDGGVRPPLPSVDSGRSEDPPPTPPRAEDGREPPPRADAPPLVVPSPAALTLNLEVACRVCCPSRSHTRAPSHLGVAYVRKCRTKCVRLPLTEAAASAAAAHRPLALALHLAALRAVDGAGAGRHLLLLHSLAERLRVLAARSAAR